MVGMGVVFIFVYMIEMEVEFGCFVIFDVVGMLIWCEWFFVWCFDWSFILVM